MSNIQVVQDALAAARPVFENVLADRLINFEREMEFALQTLSANDYSLKVAVGNQQSITDAVINLASIGLSLNPALKQAYLVPRKRAICLDISARGVCDLAIRDGAIVWAQPKHAYEGDNFKLNGYDKPPTHEYNPFSKERVEVVGAYVVAKTPTGDYLTTTMTIDEINAIRDRSDAWKSYIADNSKKNPWVTDPGEMQLKTVVKRASKYWRSGRADKAIQYLNTEGEEGITFDNSQTFIVDAIDYIEQVRVCQSLGGLEALWAKIAGECRRAKDRRSYDKLKMEVIKRSEALKADAVPEDKS
jgi:recombination protein RecT